MFSDHRKKENEERYHKPMNHKIFHTYIKYVNMHLYLLKIRGNFTKKFFFLAVKVSIQISVYFFFCSLSNRLLEKYLYNERKQKNLHKKSDIYLK